MGDHWALLRELDDPERVETPRGFEFLAARDRFRRLDRGLAERFGTGVSGELELQPETNNVNSSYLGRIVIPADLSIDRITLSVSNFFPLVGLTLGNPGSYDAQEEADFLDHRDREKIRETVAGHGYVLIPEEPLWIPYDGPNDAVRDREQHLGHPPSWWNRYFGCLYW
ncbi:hypothetical protein D5S17_01785 [Pseudonocardiaceae bacterium YIM PH 21723]|nr:hypothetical protein D5S17_01785 [Pseudonocardiaceae bacterium YIM PH 21723]